jgi:hypothetical protein
MGRTERAGAASGRKYAGCPHIPCPISFIILFPISNDVTICLMNNRFFISAMFGLACITVLLGIIVIYSDTPANKGTSTATKNGQSIFLLNTERVKKGLIPLDMKGEELTYQLPPYDFVCIPSQSRMCPMSGECAETPPSVFLLVSETYYARCDSKPCDVYESSSTTGGITMTIKPLTKSSVVTIRNDGEYSETNYLLGDAYISSGVCISKNP